MLVTIQSEERISQAALPDEMRGAYWLRDAIGVPVAFAEAREDAWMISAVQGGQLVVPGHPGPLVLQPDESAIVSARRGSDAWTVVCRPATEGDKVTRIFGFSQDARISIGRAQGNDIVYGSPYVSSHHATLLFAAGRFSVMDPGSPNGVFVNGMRVASGGLMALAPGDVLSILGLRVTIGDGLISLNNPEDALCLGEIPGLVPYAPPPAPVERTADEGGSWQADDASPENRSFFYPALRIMRTVERSQFTVDAPPQPETEDDTPIAMRVGPSLVMVMASMMSASVSLMLVMGTGGSMLRAVPLFGMALAMLAGSVVWPVANKRFQHRRHLSREAQRRGAYSQYVGRMRAQIKREAERQREILEENRLAPEACLRAAREHNAQFLSRAPQHADYLELRLGVGDVPLEADIRFPETRFEAQEDDVREALDAFAREKICIEGAPVAHGLIGQHALGIFGETDFTDALARNLLIQICALHSFADVKVIILADESTSPAWAFAKHLPHLFSNDGSMRFYASTLDEANVLSMWLEKMLEVRRRATSYDAREADPFVVLFCPSKRIYDQSRIVKDVLALKENRGFAVIACARRLHELPVQCQALVGQAESGEAHLMNRTAAGERVSFQPDPPVSIEEAQRFVLDVSTVRLDLPDEEGHLPERLSFLELFGVSNVSHLNVADRWRESNASHSLAACVGVDASGNPLTLDVHEDFHGPHGLIAGTTGSGKSEFLITYVLSLAVSYAPDEVAFVLIDYKGGGLAKAFDNDRFCLPHVAGSITNLDGSAIARSLVSLKSELRRRQRLFNETRESIGGDNVDIATYLDLYRQGRVKEPCPHLVLIADEFAELKQQEPDFMDELISASRIGRSLGVHLILATQKPSGVVNDQIWSNARFKVALKVTDAADSNEVIKRPDAARITHPGRFFLLVGYDESFVQGQSGYAGAPCAEEGGIASNVQDHAVSCISNTGRVLLTASSQRAVPARTLRSQLVAVCDHLTHVAESQCVRAPRLWLDALPGRIPLDSLMHDDPQTGRELRPIIGTFDDPANQRQGTLALPLSEEGNALVCGSLEAGAEQVVKAALFSLLRQHSARTLNAYVLDLGSGSLAAFAPAPQVGEVITAGEDEKMKRFFGFMEELITSRRQRFVPFGGSFERYCADHDDCPSILVVVNGVTAFLDAHPAFEDALTGLARDAAQAGMRLFVTAETPTGVRTRMRSAFRQVLACNLPDPADCIQLFGSLQGAPVPCGQGRGLVKKGGALLEFQAASVAPEDQNEYRCISAFCAQLCENGQGSVAPAVPVPPERVSPQLLAELRLPGGQLPYGIFDDVLTPAVFDGAEAALFRCAFHKQKAGAAFMEALVEAWAQQEGCQLSVLDLTGLLRHKPAACTFATRNDRLALQHLIQLAEAPPAAFATVVISGLAGLLARCSGKEAARVKELIRGLKVGGPLTIALMDAVTGAPSSHEDWFRAHLTNRDGLWVGPGLESQSAISVAYHGRIRPDAQMDERLGYWVEGGQARLVHLASNDIAQKGGADDRSAGVLAAGIHHLA